MIKLGKLFLPQNLDYNAKSGQITLRVPEFHSKKYFENSECFLHLEISNGSIFIDYHSDDDIYLSELLGIDGSLASGSLIEEKFEAIQSRALSVLAKYLDDSQQELLDHFEGI